MSVLQAMKPCQPNYEALNLRSTPRGVERRLQTMTIGFNPEAGRYTVKDDLTAQLVGTGYATVEDAERAHLYTDLRRIRAALVGVVEQARKIDKALNCSERVPSAEDYNALSAVVNGAAMVAGIPRFL